jgi:hypothetical protein
MNFKAVESAAVATLATINIVDKYANREVTGHRLLISPNPYNILVIYSPTAEFMSRTEQEIMGQTYFMRFLDDFIMHVLFPLIEKRVQEYFHTQVNGKALFPIFLES